MKYIDADLLRKEIERRREANKRQYHSSTGGMSWQRMCGEEDCLVELLAFLDSLQQEQPDNWNDEYQEDELLTRFAFYTYKDEESVLYLSNLFVEKTSRNKGIGTKILQAAEKVAETIGAISICLKVKQNSPANAWYRKRGYGYCTFEGEYDWLEKKLEYLKPKQEQPEVEFKIEERKWVHDAVDNIFPEDGDFMSEVDFRKILKDTARHFYELGLNARNEEKK